MRENKSQLIINYLKTTDKPVTSAKELAAFFSISERQIRKYIAAINKDKKIIFATNRGYKINTNLLQYHDTVNDDSSARVNYIIQRLLLHMHKYTAFDLSDELFVSTSTIEQDLKKIRVRLKYHNLSLKKDNDFLYIDGLEKDKRKLMSNLLNDGNQSSFSLKKEIQILSQHYQFPELRENLKHIFATRHLYINDFTLNNILLHLIIMVDRILNGYELNEDHDFTLFKNTIHYQVGKDIQKYIEDQFVIAISNAELYNLILIISNNTSMFDYKMINSENISTFIDEQYIQITFDILKKVEENYYLNFTNEEFVAKFTIHIMNLFKRAKTNYQIDNPLTKTLKNDYPLIYDISVFIAHELDKAYNIDLNEGEISFIALHIGNYFETNLRRNDKVTCTFVYTDYYSTHQDLLDKIEKRFSNDLTINSVLSINLYEKEHFETDFIISTVDYEFLNDYILISPFSNQKDMRLLQFKIEEILVRKKTEYFKSFLLDFFKKELFFSNFEAKDKYDAIQKLSENAICYEYAKKGFTEEVIAREKISSTAFHSVAIPHSLSKDSISSFISVALCNPSFIWDETNVDMIVLISVNNENRKIFSDIFEYLIEIITEPVNAKLLASNTNFNDFIHCFSMLMEQTTID